MWISVGRVTPLQPASQMSFLSIAKVFVEAKALIVVSANGYYRVVQLLLNYMYHADPTLMNYFVRTAIKVATHNGHIDIVELLETALVE